MRLYNIYYNMKENNKLPWKKTELLVPQSGELVLTYDNLGNYRLLVYDNTNMCWKDQYNNERVMDKWGIYKWMKLD